MADQQQEGAISAPFPAPPRFYHRFTKQNLAELRQLRKATQSQLSTSTASSSESYTQPLELDLLSLPPELRYLLPPPPPTDDSYRSFGSQINFHAPELSLPDAGVDQLYPDHPSATENPQPHLIALARSLLTTFLTLIDTLSTHPEGHEGMVQDIQTTMFNMHDLINRYRPHQARESLILLMEERVAQMRGEVRKITEGRNKVDGLMKGLKEAQEMSERTDGGGSIEAQSRELVEERAEDGWRMTQRDMWKAMDGVVGDAG